MPMVEKYFVMLGMKTHTNLLLKHASEWTLLCNAGHENLKEFPVDFALIYGLRLNSVFDARHENSQKLLSYCAQG